MQSRILALLVALVIILAATPSVRGRPPHRQKRVSDQRLGELEALLALKKLRGKLVTVPIGFGQIDPNEYGRRRRSAGHQSLASRMFLQQLLDSLPQEDAVADIYDDATAPAEGDASGQQHWASASWDRPAPVFSRTASSE